MQVDCEIDPTLGGVVADPARLKQVLYNYLSNALKFSRDGGRVWIRARPEDTEHWRLEVEDYGIGIEPRDVARLFQQFEQLDGGTARRHEGTGLGLALTKRLVEMQGGRVGVRSVPGRGSLFYAILPRVVHSG
jgi:signal transduction histidine kinase